ncbi:Mut7-C RNAse domain-containing protein [Rufibacter tibetensis]|uniref:Twitching motility protein PilT n=1 Tax=Rufibacter tibetensis TaxID=512763 RepID=A0A0P0C5P9_9BACT|nr:Mut7-C RNAse domain-containing protein [Rufibacter tibetensis]ALJ00516.1 hypothetical protein DC20_18005 [Rufibacter tibetensis]
MEHTAHLLFHGALNDFLPKYDRGQWVTYRFTGAPAVKDVVEACNVPHPEIGSIAVNGRKVPFSQPVQPNGKVEVYPAVAEGTIDVLPPLQISSPVPARFVLDVHLGKLVRYLRLLGFDTCYENHYDDQTIAQIAAQEQRIVLTRDIGLLKIKTVQCGYWLRSQQWEKQLREVLHRFHLMPQLQPFTRCMGCNGLIKEVEKKVVMSLLPPKTKQFFHTFYQCTHCKRVYWKGSHFDKMQRFLDRLSMDE